MRKATVAFNDPTPEGAAFRFEQAMVDADIEGLARNSETEQLFAEMDRLGLSQEERVRRVVAYYSESNSGVNAAE